MGIKNTVRRWQLIFVFSALTLCMLSYQNFSDYSPNEEIKNNTYTFKIDTQKSCQDMLQTSYVGRALETNPPLAQHKEAVDKNRLLLGKPEVLSCTQFREKYLTYKDKPREVAKIYNSVC